MMTVIRRAGVSAFFLSGMVTALGQQFQQFTGTNAPGAGTNFTFALPAAATNVSISVTGTVSVYSHLLLKRGSPPTDTSYDFISQLDGQPNAIHLERPEATTTNYYVRVRTPAASLTHAFTLLVETNRADLRSQPRPVMKPLDTQISGVATNGSRHFFRVELATNTAWRAVLEATNTVMPDLYVQRGQAPTETAYLKRSTSVTNDVVAFLPSEATPGPYFIGALVTPGALPGTAPYTLRLESIFIQSLNWDPGLTHEGTDAHTNLSGVAGDYYFRVTTANPSLGAWRVALNVLSNDANVYLSRGALPSPIAADFKSERTGSDGFVVHSSQFSPNEDWYIMVRAQAGAQWTLVSGAPYVQDLGTVADDASTGSGSVPIGPEGLRFFKSAAPPTMLAWRLWLNGATNNILIKKAGVPLPGLGANGIPLPPGVNELLQPAQALVVSPYLVGGQQYFIGVPGDPGQVLNLDSRQQLIIPLAYGGSFESNVTGFGYTTFRVQVPLQQTAWQMTLPSTNGNPNLAVRRNAVPNENYNDAYSELSGRVSDNISLVPPTLSDGTFYLTVYGTNVALFGSTNGHHFLLQNAPAVVTDINYVSTTVNDDTNRFGWRYYRVTDINQQLGTLGWDLFLTNFAPGTRIALRRNSAPGIWNFRSPSSQPVNYYDLLSVADYLQVPGHQADVWYIGVYNPTNALRNFTLYTRELQADPLTNNAPSTLTNVPAGRWSFFQLTVPSGAAGSNILGWDVRLTNVTAGSPRVVVRREGFPTSLNTDLLITATNWPSGKQWAAGNDWTRRTFSPDGLTNEDGRILVMGMGRPLEPGIYYIGVLNPPSDTNNMSFTLVSRWIGPGQTIPVYDLTWSGGNVTNAVAPRQAVYYRVNVPVSRSWKVRLDTLGGEAMLVASTNWVPSMDTEKHMQKAGREHYLRLPPPGGGSIITGLSYLAVVGEGVNPTNANRIGVGDTSFILQTFGALPETDLGLLTTTDLARTDVLEGGESKAYHFNTLATTLGFWIFLEDKIGNPVAVSRGDLPLADPGLGADPYGNEGGEFIGAIASATFITVADPYPTETIMVKARGSGSIYADASYKLRVQEIIPDPLGFDNGSVVVTDANAVLGKYFYVDIPPGALGWDVRLINVTAGRPQLVVRRDGLPISLDTFGFIPATSTNWPSLARWVAGRDWTERAFSADNLSNEDGRILAMGMGRPLESGRYYIAVLNSGGGTNMGFTLVSRGIGPGLSIPVTDLAFTGGSTSVTNLPPREAAYYRVNIPNNTRSWKVHLQATVGESLLIALKDALPNVGATPIMSTTNLVSGGRKMQKLDDEHFILLPGPGLTNLPPGLYYLAVVSEGATPLSVNQVGAAGSTFTLISEGEAPIIQLGEIGVVDTVVTNILAGGDTHYYQFSVAPGTLGFEARLTDRAGNPVMVLRPGAQPPDPGTGVPVSPIDPYGNDGGGTVGNDVHPLLISVANPTNGAYTLIVKARATPNVSPPAYTNAGYTLRLNASGASFVEFDTGAVSVTNQSPGAWRYFRVIVPTNALGWDLRLSNVSTGFPRLVVRRLTLPNSLATTPWAQPGLAVAWPSNYQWAPGVDWTKRNQASDGVDETGRYLAVGMGRPLEPGLYYVGVLNALNTTNIMTYTVVSRGIGPGFAIPVVDLPFVGSVTNLALAPREAAYYRVVVPSNAPSWKVRLAGLQGESMLAIQSNAVPSIESANLLGTVATGKGMQRLGNEHFLFLPSPGGTNIPAGTNFIAVISEGVNPASATRIGVGDASYTLASLGAAPVTDLGLLTSEDLVQSDALEGGESKAYQFTVPIGMVGMNIRLENREGNPALVVGAGVNLPDPGNAPVGSGLVDDRYGNQGGYTPTNGHALFVTVPNPIPGSYSVMVKARLSGPSYPDARYTLRLQEALIPEMNFSSAQNTNGLTNSMSGLLLDNERTFFKFLIPATHNGQPVIGWKLDLTNTSGQAWLRVRRAALPADSDAASLMPFTPASAIIAPPFLTNGLWFVEVKGSNSAAFSLKSSALELERPAWVMPPWGQTNVAPGVVYPFFGDSGIGTNGIPLAGDQGIFLEQGSSHYYAVQVPETNQGVLRVQLDGLSANPDLYLRVGGVPTLNHATNGATGRMVERSMTLSGVTEYANWVPIDGKLESRLKPGLWYFAVSAAGNANARYRLRVSVGAIMDLPLHSLGVTNQTLASNDWRYYRIQVPTAVPFTYNLTFVQESGDVFVYQRDTVPPGNADTWNVFKDWLTDNKNNGPYPSFDAAGTYTFNVPPVRPGHYYYFGVRANGDAAFSLKITTNGVVGTEPLVVPFYGGTASTNLPAFAQTLYRIDVPTDATRFKMNTTHSTNIYLFLEQGTTPVRGTHDWPFVTQPSTTSLNSVLNENLVVWDNTLKQYVPRLWPWVPGQSYYLLITNSFSSPQLFTMSLDGRNAATDDNDNDLLPDAWEYFYFSNLFQIATSDFDLDGVNNLDEFRDSTDPTASASYRPRLYTIAANGSISRNPDLTNFALGSQVVLTPVPAPGYAFVGWSSNASGLSNPLTLTMDSPKTVVANFKLAGDDFITALNNLAGASGTVIALNVSMTKEPGEPNHAGNPGGKSIWWRWVAPASGTATLSTLGSTFNTLLAVYTGPTVSNLTAIASDRNSVSGTNWSQVTFIATGGTTYNIAVDGLNAASSRITLNLSLNTTNGPPPNPLELQALLLLSGGQVQLQLGGDPNRTYYVDGSVDLISWTQLGTITTLGNGLGQFTDAAAAAYTRRFYRVRSQ